MDKEYNELKSKSQEAGQEFTLAQSKVSDAREQLTKLRKDLDGKILSLYVLTRYRVGKVKKVHYGLNWEIYQREWTGIICLGFPLPFPQKQK